MSSEPSNKESDNQNIEVKPIYAKRRFKWLVGSVLFTLFLIFGFAKLTEYLAGNLMKTQVNEHSNGAYELVYSNLDINWIKTEIQLTEFEYKRVSKDSSLEKELYFGAVNATINLENLRGIYFKNALHILKITVQSPDLRIVKFKDSVNKTSFSLESGDLYKLIQGFVKSFQIDDFEVINLHADYRQNYKVPNKHYVVNDLSFTIRNFKLDSTAVASNNEFFFTESFSLKIKNQSFNFGDSIHQVHFDSLVLSTNTNNLEIFNLQIDTLSGAEGKLQHGNFNQYALYAPYIGINGLDFKKAYVENVLHIDSIIFDNLNLLTKLKSITREKEKVKVDTTVNNRIINVLLTVFDRLELVKFNINNAQVQVRYTNQDKASVKGLNLAFYNYLIDSNALSSRSYFPVYDGLKLAIIKPEFDLPNGNHLNAKILHFSTFDSTLIIDDVLLKAMNKSVKDGTDIRIDQIKLTGVNPKEIIANNEINLNKLVVLHPQLQLINVGNQNKTSTLDLRKFLDGKIKRYHINKVEIKNGDAKLMSSKFKSSPNKIGKFNITLNGFTLDQKSIKRNKFLLANNSYLRFTNVQIFIPKIQHYVKASQFNISSIGGVLQASNLILQPSVSDSSSLKVIANVKVNSLKLAGIDFQHLKSIKAIDLSKLILNGVDAQINQIGSDTIASDTSKNEFLKDLTSIKLKNVDIHDVDLILQKHGVSVAKFSNAYVLAELLEAHEGKLANGRLVFMTDSIEYGLDRLMAPLTKQNHMLFVGSIKRKKDSSLTIKGVSIRPIPGKVISDSAMKLVSYIPEIKFTDFHTFENHFTDSLELGQIVISKPMVRLRLPIRKDGATKKFKLESNLPDGFLDNEFETIGLELFKIVDGNITIQKEDLSVAVHKLNLDSKDWFITKNSTWDPDKFLYANDFNLSLEELDYKFPGVELCHHVDSLSYHFKPNNLTVSGIYFNNWSLNGMKNKSEISLYLPFLKLENPNIYRYLNDSIISIDRIITEKGFFEADIYEKSTNKEDTSKLKITLPTEISNSIKGFDQLAIHQFLMDKMDVEVRIHKNGVVTPLEMDHFSLQVDSFHIYPGEQLDSNRILWSDNIELSVKNVYTKTDGGLYELGADELRLSTRNDTLGIEGLSFVPTVGRYEYALHKGHQKAVFNISLKQFGVSGLAYNDLLYKKEIRGAFVHLESPSLAILKDKRIPKAAYKRKEIIPEMFKRLPIKITFDSVKVDEMKIRYEEFPQKGRKPGNIMLTHMNIAAYNVTNDTLELKQDSALRIFMTSKLLDTADLELYLEYNMLTPDNVFKMSTSLGSFDGTLMNRYIEPVFSAKILSANVDRMEMSVIGNDSISGGRMGLYYSDLKFTFLNKETHEQKGFSTKFKSMIGNSIIKSNNKYHAFKRREPLFFERITGKGWINYLIKIELAGVASSVGLKHYKKELKKANKEVWKQFDKAYKAERKAKAKATKKAEKSRKKAEKRLKKNLS